MKAHVPFVSATLALALGCACNSNSSDNSNVREPKAHAQAETANDEPEDVVKLLDAGKEPRAQLRYRHVAGRSERLVMGLELTHLLETTVEPDEEDALVKVALDMGATTPVRSGVSARPMRLELLGIETPQSWSKAQRNALAQQLAPLSQVSANFQIDTRGLTQRMALSLPPGGSPRLLTTIGNVRSSLVSAPLPLEPVGVGARWQMERPVLVGPIRAHQTVTYTLLESRGAELRIGVSLLQTAAPQKVALGKDGTTLSLEAYEGRAVGSSRVNLGNITPVAELRGGSELHAILHRNGQPDQAVSTGGALLIRIAPAAQTP